MIEYVLYTSIFDSILYPVVKPTWLYRIIQKLLEGIGIYAVYTFWGIDTVVACLVCHYFLVQDRLFYLLRNEEDVVRWYEGAGKVPDWLNKWYFSGYWMFKDYFSIHRFDLSLFIGLVAGYIIVEFKIASFILEITGLTNLIFNLTGILIK